jgi:hypothetical protein
MQACIAFLTVFLLPPDAPCLNIQGFMWAVWHANTAIITPPNGPGIMAGFTAQVTSLQKQRQATARPIHAGERNNLTN